MEHSLTQLDNFVVTSNTAHDYRWVIFDNKVDKHRNKYMNM